jgi:beta-ribofuranosylaminobenzene 5'-phosphate synthase
MDCSRTAPEALLADPRSAVTLRAPGRLHLGFLDPAGSLGRRFGSLGLVVDGCETEVGLSASAGNKVVASGRAEEAEVGRAAACLQLLQRHSGCHAPLQLKLVRVLPAHAGFGSGTQLALAIGRAFAQWHRMDLSTPTLAQWLGRGVRSGIGVAGFDQGGLLVDGGPRADGGPAPVLSRVPLPAAWRVVVVQDSTLEGLSGADERQALATLSPLPQALAADICHQVLMRVLPGAADAEFAPFAVGINRIQQVMGEHFAAAQGGSAFTSPAVGRLMAWIGGAGQAAAAGEAGAATGQSSWGPTGFAIVPTQALAETLVAAARAAHAVAPHLRVRIVSGRNTGADVVDSRLPARAR